MTGDQRAYRGAPPNPDGDEPASPHDIAVKEAETRIENAQHYVDDAESRVARADDETRSAALNLRHAQARLAAARLARESLDPQAVGMRVSVDPGGITLPGSIFGESHVVTAPEDPYAVRVNDTLEALDSLEAGLRSTIAGMRTRDSEADDPVLMDLSDFQIGDRNGRPLLLDVIVARAQLLAAIMSGRG